jgi:holo-[acyl-carrier protein] synthase
MSVPASAVTTAARCTTGVDLVDVGRIARLAGGRAALGGVLTARELAYCFARAHAAEHVAGRFAAKEAVLKALGTGRAGAIGWTDVEVLNDDAGVPVVHLHGACAARASRRGLVSLAVSISHTADLAIAHAVAVWPADPTPGQEHPDA